MNIRPKTVRRIALFVILCGTVFGGGLLAWRHNEQAKRDRAAADRDAGLVAFQSGDYDTALALLGRYINRFGGEPTALRAYAESRSRVELPGGQHLNEAIAILTERLLVVYPKDDAGRRLLLQLYVDAQRNDLAAALAGELLESHPNEPAILRAQAIALSRTDRVNEALAASLAYNRVAPSDCREQLRTLWLMDRRRDKPQQLVDHAKALLAGHEEDSQLQVVMAVAFGYAGDNAAALKHLRLAAASPDNDPATIREIVSKFDNLGRSDESRRLLQRAADRSGDASLRRLLVERLWLDRRPAELVQLLAGLDRSDRNADAQLLAMRALAYSATGNADAAQRDYAALSSRAAQNGTAAAWSAALASRLVKPELAARDVVSRLRAAIARERENGLFRAWAGDAYWSLGETELAIANWTDAADLLPGWSEPAAKIGQARLATGGTQEAIRWASESYRRGPTPEHAADLVAVRFAQLEVAPKTMTAEALLGQVRSVRTVLAGDDRLLAIEATLLCRLGRYPEATGLVRKELAAAPPLSEGRVLSLLRVSRDEGLGLDDAIFAAAPRTASRTLAIALGHAQAGDRAAALAIFDEAPSDVAWQSARAQLLQRLNHPAAAAGWKQLGDTFPRDLSVQQLILAAADAARSDRAFIERTIDRLKELTGESSQHWRIERSRWLLSSGGYDDSAAAVGMLRDSVDPKIAPSRILLARGLEQTGNAQTAFEHLRAAADRDVRDAAPVLELMRLCRAQGRTHDAMSLVTRAAREGSLRNDQRLQIAEWLADEGEVTRAVELLTFAEAAGANDRASRLRLAMLQASRGQLELAGQLLEKLLAAPAPRAEDIGSAAMVAAQKGEIDSLDRLLTKLEAKTAFRAASELALGRLEERLGNVTAARRHFRAVVELSRESLAGWAALARLELGVGEYAASIKTVDRAAAAGVTDAPLATVRLDAEIALALGGVEQPLLPLIAALDKDPSRRPLAGLLAIARDVRAHKLTPVDETSRLDALAATFPRDVAVQRALATAALRAGDATRAMRVASKLAGQVTTAQAAAAAYEIARDAGRWDQARSFAEQWLSRDHGDGNALAACIDAALASGDTASALKHAAPHLAMLRAHADRLPALRYSAGLALLSTGDRGASELLQTMPPAMRQAAALRLPSAEAADRALRPTEFPSLFVPARSRIRGALARAVAAERFGMPSWLERAAMRLTTLPENDRFPDAARLMGRVRLQQDRPDLAETPLRQAMKISPDAATANDLACALLLMDRRGPEARELATFAANTAPKTAAYHDTLARACVSEGDFVAAARSFEAALAAEPDHLDALLGYAALHDRLGRREAAKTLLAQIDNSVAKRSPRRDATLRELEALRESLSRLSD